MYTAYVRIGMIDNQLGKAAFRFAFLFLSVYLGPAPLSENRIEVVAERGLRYPLLVRQRALIEIGGAVVGRPLIAGDSVGRACGVKRESNSPDHRDIASTYE